jgi:hypothetical protein
LYTGYNNIGFIIHEREMIRYYGVVNLLPTGSRVGHFEDRYVEVKTGSHISSGRGRDNPLINE